MTMDHYSPAFYADLKDGSQRSAEVVVPLLIELLACRSVVDVGCGVGTWLAEFARCGVEDYLGLDTESVPGMQLSISSDRFLARDIGRPIHLDRRFDAALCLEVAEHLPSDAAAILIANLAALAPVIAFSAAVPFQGGTNHVNEQWPQYWAALFAELDYVPADALRLLLWNDSRVTWWYAQNLLLFVHRAKIGEYPKLQPTLVTTPLSLVHPANYLQHADVRSAPVRSVVAAMPTLLARGLKALLGLDR